MSLQRHDEEQKIPTFLQPHRPRAQVVLQVHPPSEDRFDGSSPNSLKNYLYL